MPESYKGSWVLAAVALLSACTGQIDGGGSRSGGKGNGNGDTGGTPPGGTGGSGPGGTGGAGGGVPPITAQDDPGTAVFRRLSRTEYNNTVRDLLGDATAPANS